MQMSGAGLALLVELEGSAPLPYRDIAGMLTLGVGHLLTRDELASGKVFLPAFGWCHYGTAPWPSAWIDSLLRDDLRIVEQAVGGAVQVPLTQGQYDCLCCFIFNIGGAAFRHSTLLRLLNRGEYAAVPEQLHRWIYAGGRVIEGLRLRRAREVTMWETTIKEGQLPRPEGRSL